MPEICLTPEAMNLFMETIGPSIIEIYEGGVQINAENGPVIWEWIDALSRFCLGGNVSA